MPKDHRAYLLLGATIACFIIQMAYVAIKRKADIYLAGMSMLALVMFLYNAADTQWGSMLAAQGMAWQAGLWCMNSDQLQYVCTTGAYLSVSKREEDREKWRKIYAERVAELEARRWKLPEVLIGNADADGTDRCDHTCVVQR